MANQYKAVIWNANKRAYDLVLIACVVGFVGAFSAVSVTTAPPGEQVTPAILVIRALGICAFLMLHVVLAIGPLARLSPVFLPLLYNRRHLGVMLFLVALGHAAIATVWYHGFGTINPFVSVLTSNDQVTAVSPFPFELFGVAALIILFLMAATSHDYWLATLGAGAWKTLHMFVYLAYTLLVMHVALGILQDATSNAFAILLIAGAAVLVTLHLAAGLREWRRDRTSIWDGSLDQVEWIHAARVDELVEGCAKVVQLGEGERIAIWRYDGKIAATSNVCAHQAGPLGEGRIIDGCITCPWHGYQYDPATGRSPPPFTEKISTYEAKLVGNAVHVRPTPLPPGTAVTPIAIPPGL